MMGVSEKKGIRLERRREKHPAPQRVNKLSDNLKAPRGTDLRIVRHMFAWKTSISPPASSLATSSE
jgi:hypothetical protein